MNKFFTLLLVAALTSGIASTTLAGTGTSPDEKAAIEALEASAAKAISKVQWKQFSENLVDALQSDHAGLKQAAMRLVIRHGDNVSVKDAVFDVMRIYRDGDEENLRRMAVVTLANMKSDWAIKFLERSERFEKSSVVSQTIRAVLAEARVS